jgi:hypothetical protein
MATVFISYIHEELKIAEAVQRLIQNKLANRDVFMSADQWQMYAGEDWLQKITAALRTARVVVLLLSPQSVLRPWVNFEAGGAWLAGTPVIPVCHAGLRPESLPKPYSSLQALVVPGDEYYLIHSIAHYLATLSPPPWWDDDEEMQVFRAALSGSSCSDQISK